MEKDHVVEFVPSRLEHRAIKMDEERTIGIYAKRGETRFVAGWLVCIEGPSKGMDYRIYAGFNRIGRDYASDIVLREDLQVSRREHCSVVYEEKKNVFYIVPKAGNLTYLNGKLIESAIKIHNREQIKIGESVLEFVAFCEGDRRWE